MPPVVCLRTGFTSATDFGTWAQCNQQRTERRASVSFDLQRTDSREGEVFSLNGRHWARKLAAAVQLSLFVCLPELVCPGCLSRRRLRHAVSWFAATLLAS